MKFGVLLSNGVRGDAPGAVQLDELVAKAALARRLGYDSLWLVGGPLSGGWHMLTPLARLAAETGDMELGSVLLLPLYNPIEVAEQVATLHAICGGGFILGAGQGWQDAQYSAFGIPKSERLPRFLEYLEAMNKLWTKEVVDFRGRFLTLKGARGYASAFQDPPQVLIGANMDPGVERAPRIGDGWLVRSRSTLPTIIRQLALYRQTCEEVGVPGRVVAFRQCFVAGSRAEAVEAIGPYAAAQHRRWVANEAPVPEADRMDRPFEELLEGRFILGDPEECAAEIERYRALGIEEFVLGMEWPGTPADLPLGSMRLFAETVMPEFS